MNRWIRRLAFTIVAAVIAGLLPACGARSGDARVEPAVHHPLFAVLEKARASFGKLSPDDAQTLNDFLRFAGTDASPSDLRDVSAAAGRALSSAKPRRVAAFVLAAVPWLYDEFFEAFDRGQLPVVAAEIGKLDLGSELDRLRIQAILRRGGAAYEGPLSRAMTTIGFAEAVAPRQFVAKNVLPGDGASDEDLVGSAEILRLPQFMKAGGRADLAAQTWRRVLRKKPGNPVASAGLACLLLEQGDPKPEVLSHLLKVAEGTDPENAAWPYLRAAVAFRNGEDDVGLAALKTGCSRPRLTFFTLTRAKETATRLKELGYGPIQAGIAAYRAVSLAGWFQVKDLADRTLKRSAEYESSGRKKDVELVLGLPGTLDRQIRAAPRVVFTEMLRGTMLATGLDRLVEYDRSIDKPIPRKILDKILAARSLVSELEKASNRWAGERAWSRYCRGLGEARFRTYLDSVLFGNEAAFLLAAAGAKSPKAVLALTQKPWAFK